MLVVRRESRRVNLKTECQMFKTHCGPGPENGCDHDDVSRSGKMMAKLEHEL